MNRRVLIADDDRAICDAISLILDDAGYDVTTTLDGRTVSELDGDLPDIILLDIRLSGIDGRDICRQLKSQPMTSRIPVILISANKDTPAIASEVGADGFVSKPFELDDLLATLEEHLPPLETQAKGTGHWALKPFTSTLRVKQDGHSGPWALRNLLLAAAQLAAT